MLVPNHSCKNFYKQTVNQYLPRNLHLNLIQTVSGGGRSLLEKPAGSQSQMIAGFQMCPLEPGGLLPTSLYSFRLLLPLSTLLFSTLQIVKTEEKYVGHPSSDMYATNFNVYIPLFLYILFPSFSGFTLLLYPIQQQCILLSTFMSVYTRTLLHKKLFLLLSSSS